MNELVAYLAKISRNSSYMDLLPFEKFSFENLSSRNLANISPKVFKLVA